MKDERVMQLYEVKKYFGRNYFSTCQHCGARIYKRNKGGLGKHAWLPYSKAAYKQDADYEVLCRGCYDEAVSKYGSMISREEILKRIDRIVDVYRITGSNVISGEELNQALFGRGR